MKKLKFKVLTESILKKLKKLNEVENILRKLNEDDGFENISYVDSDDNSYDFEVEFYYSTDEEPISGKSLGIDELVPEKIFWVGNDGHPNGFDISDILNTDDIAREKMEEKLKLEFNFTDDVINWLSPSTKWDDDKNHLAYDIEQQLIGS